VVSVLVLEEAVAMDNELPATARIYVESFNSLIGAVPPESEWLDELEEDDGGRPDADIIDMAAHIEMVNRMMT
jgi:hypothetical protein